MTILISVMKVIVVSGGGREERRRGAQYVGVSSQTTLSLSLSLTSVPRQKLTETHRSELFLRPELTNV